MPRKPNTLIFDIETGGKYASQSSILELAYKQTGEKADVITAAPSPGSFMSVWSEKNVWERASQRGLKSKHGIVSERELLAKFLTILETAPEGTRLAGWNIGYGAGKAGYDVPFMLRRAERYGMEKRFRKAVQRHQIIDLGAEYAWNIAKSVTKHGKKLVGEGVLTEELYEQAVGYVKKGAQLKAEYGLKSSEIPEFLAKGGFKFAGWKQETTHILLGMGEFAAHDPLADIGAARRTDIYRKMGGKLDEAFVRRWSKEALMNRLIASAKYTPYDEAEAIPKRFQDLMSQAVKMESDRPDVYGGFAESFQKKLRKEVTDAGGKMADVWSGRGVSDKGRKIMESDLGSKLATKGRPTLAGISDDVLKFASQRKGLIAVGAGVVGLMALKPGSWFSGKDDAYNTIEGLPHGGQAEQMRQVLTDFGSGYKGLPEALMGQKIDPRILRQRADVIDDKERRKAQDAEIARKQKIQMEKLGEFEAEDIFEKDLSTTEAINARNVAFKAIRLKNFNINVEDADTLILKRKGPAGLFAKDISIRLAGIDAPEVAGHEGDPLEDVRIFQEQAGGAEATQELQRLIGEQDDLQLVVNTGEKTYGRYLGALVGDDERNLNVELIRRGAVAALPFGKSEEDLVQRREAEMAERQARETGAGLWGHARYQAIHEATRNVGRDITFNTFTRIDKLAQNLNLGAYASFLEDLGGQKRRLTRDETARAQRMGRALSRSHGGRKPGGSRFSGKDDAYNTIESFTHGGLASGARPHFGFGSGAILSTISKMRNHLMQPLRVRAAKKAGLEVIQTDKKEFFSVGKLLGEGGMGKVHEAKSLLSGREGVYKTAQEGMEIPKSLVQEGQDIFPRGMVSMLSFSKEGRFLGLREGVKNLHFQQATGAVQEMNNAMRHAFAKGKYTTHLHYEAAMQSQAHALRPDIVPKVFGTTEKGFIQELAGRAVAKSGPERKAAQEFIKKEVGPMTTTHRGIMHFDPSPENLVINPEGKFKLIDWGVAAPAINVNTGRDFEVGYKRIVNRVLAGEGAPQFTMSGSLPQKPIVSGLGPPTRGAKPGNLSIGTGTGGADMLSASREQKLQALAAGNKAVSSVPPGAPASAPSSARKLLWEQSGSAPGLSKSDLSKNPKTLSQNTIETPTPTMILPDSDFKSPVDLGKATMKAQGLMSARKSLGKKLASGIQQNAERSRKLGQWHAKHKEAQVRASAGWLRAGKRHRHKAGRLVI